MDVYRVSGGDGWRDIAKALAGRHDLKAIHLFSHGSDGAVKLGDAALTSRTLPSYAKTLADIGAAFQPGGELLIYSCNVAERKNGKQFVRKMASASGLRIAASTDLSGPATDGGNWTLEFSSGPIGSNAPLAALSGYNHFLPSGTITASGGGSGQNYGTVFSDGMANSQDIPGIQINFSYTPDPFSSGSDILFAPAGTNLGTTPLAQDYLIDSDAGNNGQQNLTVQSASGTNFSLEQIRFADYSGYETSSGSIIKLEAYRDGSYIGTSTFTFVSGSEQNVNQGDELSAAFSNVDKVVISSQNGNPISLGFNNITVNDPVLPNAAPTDITLNSTSVNQSGAVNAFVGSLGSSDPDGDTSFSYSLVAGSGDADNGYFNINGDLLQANDASAMTARYYSVRIRTDDGKGGTYDEPFSIQVIDDLAPSFANMTPSVSGTTTTSTTLSVQLDEIGTAYYVVVPDGAPAPNTSQVMSGQNAGGGAALQSGTINISSAGMDYTSGISGLSSNTSYDIYVAAGDDSSPSNDQGIPTLVNLTTLASSNADLFGLTLSSSVITPSFNPSTTSYTASVAYQTTSVTVTPTVADASASVTVNGSAVASGNAAAVSLSYKSKPWIFPNTKPINLIRITNDYLPNFFIYHHPAPYHQRMGN